MCVCWRTSTHTFTCCVIYPLWYPQAAGRTDGRTSSSSFVYFFNEIRTFFSPFILSIALFIEIIRVLIRRRRRRSVGEFLLPFNSCCCVLYNGTCFFFPLPPYRFRKNLGRRVCTLCVYCWFYLYVYGRRRRFFNLFFAYLSSHSTRACQFFFSFSPFLS